MFQSSCKLVLPVYRKLLYEYKLYKNRESRDKEEILRALGPTYRSLNNKNLKFGQGRCSDINLYVKDIDSFIINLMMINCDKYVMPSFGTDIDSRVCGPPGEGISFFCTTIRSKIIKKFSFIKVYNFEFVVKKQNINVPNQHIYASTNQRSVDAVV